MPQVSYVEIAIQFLGGLGMFIYGMHVMAAGLQKSAGSRMRSLLEALTKNKLLGVLIGSFVTAIIQSSSATTVMVVGFVNAGLLNLTQSVGVIMGANIGTTITSWLVASVEWSKYFNPIFLSPIFVAVGAAMVLFSKKNMPKQIGEILVGFGILFIGMNTMSTGVEPLRTLPFFQTLFVELGSNPLLGILAGTVVTGIIQSSSASVGILQSLAIVGLVPWNAAVYIIMGQNIGTCVTALLSSIGTSKTAKSAAYIHLSFNVIGTVIFSVISIIFFTFINPELGMTTISLTEISIVHTSFNIASTILIYPFSNYLIKIAEFLVSKQENEVSESELVHLDDRILQNPNFAIENCIKEIVRMGKLAAENLKLSTEALTEKDMEKVEIVLKREKNIDDLSQAITQYLVKLCNTDVSPDDKAFITDLFQSVNDVERVGDHCENIAELAMLEDELKVTFSSTAQAEMKEIVDLTINCYSQAIECFESSDKDQAKKIFDMEETIDVLEKKLRMGHITRLASNECNSTAGIVFLDALTNLERISDHANNIAGLVINKKK